MVHFSWSKWKLFVNMVNLSFKYSIHFSFRTSCFQLQQSHNFLVLVKIVLQVVFAFGVLFCVCEIGQRVNIAYDECGQMIDEFKWYSFPAEIQRMLPMIINFVQQPIEIKCFGTTACDREAFKYVSIIWTSCQFLYKVQFQSVINLKKYCFCRWSINHIRFSRCFVNFSNKSTVRFWLKKKHFQALGFNENI